MYTLKSFKNTAVAGVLVLGSAAGFSHDASAATSNAVADFDWSQFTVTTVGDISITFGAQSDSAVATAASNGVNPLVTFGPVVTPNWDDGVFANAETGNANYNGNTTAQTPVTVSESGAFQSDSHTFSQAAGWDVNVNSSATRSLDFTATGSGFVLFSVNYNLFVETADGGTSLANDKADASARVSALLKNLTNNAAPIGTATAALLASFDNAASNFGSSDSASGTLGVAVFFNDGDSGHFDFTAESAASTVSPAAVPLPPAGWLLGASLVMLARRRRA